MLSKQHASFTATPQVFWDSWFLYFVCWELILLAPNCLAQFLQVVKFNSKEGTEQGIKWVTVKGRFVSLERNLLGQVRMEWQKPVAASLSSSPKTLNQLEYAGKFSRALSNYKRSREKVWYRNIKRCLKHQLWKLNSFCWEEFLNNFYKLLKFGFLLKCGICSDRQEKKVVTF